MNVFDLQVPSTSREPTFLEKILFPRPRIICYGSIEMRFSRKQWLLLHRLHRSPDRTLSLGEASEAAFELEPIWQPDKRLRIDNMRNMASKINLVLRNTAIPYRVRFHKDGRCFELVCLIEPVTVPESPAISSISREKIVSVERCEAVKIDSREIDDILPRLKPAFDDIFAGKNDITVAGSCCILIAVVSNRTCKGAMP